MKRFLPYSLLLTPLLLSCSNAQSLEDKSILASQQALAAEHSRVEQEAGIDIGLEKAKQLAFKHLALKQVKWGEPTSTREDENNFYLSYKTPEKELKLIGSRVIIVEKESGVVSIQKRR
jgi:hypothetical protein